MPGVGWTTEPSGTGEWLRGVWGTSSTDVYAVGEGGVVLRRADGSWDKVHQVPPKPGHGEDLLRVWATLDGTMTKVFAVGGSTLLYYDGTTWIDVSLGFAGDVGPLPRAVWGTSASDVYVLGTRGGSDVCAEPGFVLHFNGTSWSKQHIFTVTQWFSTGLWGASATNIFAVVESDVQCEFHEDSAANWIYEFNGSEWRPVFGELFTHAFLWDIAGSSGDDVIAVGNRHIVHGRR